MLASTPMTMSTPLIGLSRTCLTALLALALPLGGGCAAAASGLVSVYAPAGTRQCEPAPADPMPAALQRLAAAGVTVSAPRCGHDGRVRAAMCGLPDGRILVVDVPAASLEKVRELGWRPLADLPDARVERCE